MTNPTKNNVLKIYFAITYVIVVCLASDSIPVTSIYQEGWLSFGFMIVTFLLYSLYYLLPAITITTLASWLNQHYQSKHKHYVYATAIATGGITTLLIYANAKIFSLYGMFFNGFILNLITTPGGIESLGGSSASDIGFALIAIGFLSLQIAVLWLAHRCSLSTRPLPALKLLPAAALIVTVIVHMGFALDRYTTNQLNIVAESIPFFQPVSARHFYKRLGLDMQEAVSIRANGRLQYPLKPLEVATPEKPYNIIWLTSESWRADTLNEHIMPNSWHFSKDAARFTRNYSTGNGTRMGVFGMFTGLPGSYWFPFLGERRGAALIDVLQKQQYQMRFYTSARFTYPEFDKSIFARVPKAQLQETRVPKSGWENDRDNVTDLLSYIDQRDKEKPFFTFMFFESPHARYYFPKESVIATPYRDDLNYATLSKEALSSDIVQIKNRYINSVHHLDMQFGRIFSYLKAHQLMDTTIVVLIGDHGEEFMENGYWGHNSTFADPQVRTPLVIYTPGMKPSVSNQMTSHMDVIPTIMPLLGVKNKSTDYALGYDLFSDEKRNHTYIADWDKVTYVDDDVKITQPVNGKSFAFVKATTGKDETISKQQRQALLKVKQNHMLDMVKDLGKFFAPKSSKVNASPI